MADSLVVHLEDPAGGNGELLLFVQLRDGVRLDDALRRRIATALRTELSPRHIPDAIAAGARGPAQPHRQEAGAAGEARSCSARPRRRGQPRGAGRPDLAGRVRRSSPPPGATT